MVPSNDSVFSAPEIGDILQKWWVKLLTFKDFCVNSYRTRRSLVSHFIFMLPLLSES